MVNAERINVTLSGGAPWGFRLSGGGALPLTINKIRKKSKAHDKGLREGDAVISINGIPVHDKSQDEALELVEGAGDALALEIFRGDIDELSRDKPKKPIQIGGGGGLTLTATVDDVSESANPVSVQDDQSSGLILTASVDDVSSNTFETDVNTVNGFSATLGDVSADTFGTSQEMAGFTLSATVDDVTSSNNNMVDSITAELGDMSSSSLMSSSQVESLQASSALSPSMMQANIQSRSPNRLSPHPPRASASPNAYRLSPKPVQDNVSPRGFSPVAFSPKPKDLSPQPPAVQPKPASPLPIKSVSPRSPVPFQPPVSPKPSTISSSSKTTTFDDGQTRREVTVEQRVRGRDNGYGTTVMQRETTNTTQRTPFVKSQASAFEAPQQSSAASTTRTTKTTTTIKSVEKKGPTPFTPSPAASAAAPQQQQMNISTITSTKSGTGIAPVFKPTKFVPGQGKKDVPGLFSPSSPKVEVNVHAMFRDGKENMQPTPPMFQVKNNVSEKTKARGQEMWKPNVWLPGQRPSENSPRERVASVSDDFSPYSSFPVPVVQPGQSLVDKAKRSLKESQMRKPTYEDEYEYEDEHDYYKRDNKMHIFAPPVEVHNLTDSGYHDSPYSAYLPYSADGEPLYDYEDGFSSPESTLRKKNLYADSAFYDTPGKSYPTINEQMKLCKRIAHSLTSQANRRARGAKMFMKRKRKSSKWIHEGHSEWSSSAGDVANIHELDSELSPDEGGNKPLFYFKIPNLKTRIGSTEKKMALTRDQFEKLRLQSAKCDHKVVSPNACFDLVADLKASKGRGGRMFEKRRNRAEKYVIDENNARRSMPKAKLEKVLNAPIPQETTPWNAAIQHGGNVDAAFSHLSEMERNQKLNQILKYTNPYKQPTTPMSPVITPMETQLFHTSLKNDNPGFVLKGTDFNRSAKGWSGGGEYPIADQLVHISAPSKITGLQAQPATTSPQYGDYNPRIKAWQQPEESPAARSSSRRQDQSWDAPKQSNWQTSARGQHQDWRQQPQQQPEARYDSWQTQTSRQTETQNRPTSWQSDSYDANTYRDEYDYNYVPVDYKFNQGEYPNVAYMQPIIPGTDL